jgi:hypothetical protein
MSDVEAARYGAAMHGPEPRGHWTAQRPQAAFAHLTPGVRFEVVRNFMDYDGEAHLAGESWTFLGHSFLTHDDGLSLFVSLDGEREWHIRLQWRDDQQGPIIDALDAYIHKAA